MSTDLPDSYKILHYDLLTKGNRYDGYPSGNIFFRKDTLVYGRAMTNLMIVDLYQTVIVALWEQQDQYYTLNRRLLTFEDTAREYYNFNIIVPPARADSPS